MRTVVGCAHVSWGAVVLALQLGCAQEITLRARIGTPPPQPGEGLKAGTSLSALTLSGGVELERFQIVLRQVRLESVTTVGDKASAGKKGLLEGPMPVDLTGAELTPEVLTQIISGIHAGPYDYDELDADLAPVTATEARDLPDLAGLSGKSLVVSGSYQGRSFTFISSVTAVLKSKSVYRIGTNHNGIDLNFDPTRWFVGVDGEALDPADPAQQGTIEQNVVRSFSAYGDDDLDGVPDPLG